MSETRHRPDRNGKSRQQEGEIIFEDILRAVDELNGEERRLLRRHIDQRPEKPVRLTPKEGVGRLNAAFDAMSEGLSQARLDEMTAAMIEN